MGYRPKNENVQIGDTWHMSDCGKVQAYFLQYQQTGKPMAGKEYGAVGRAESEDLIQWKTLPSAIYSGEKGTYDDLPIWTGCTVKKDGKYYLFYTSRSTSKPQASISVAISKDGVKYEKYSGNPVIIPDERYYVGQNTQLRLAHHGNPHLANPCYDMRDLCVVKDEEKGCYWGFFACRRRSDDVVETSVVGLAKSYDLLNWEQLPPCFVPNRYHCIETPDVFYMDGKWYMLCLAGNVYGQRRYGKEKLQYGRITVYGVSDRVEGPYVEPEQNLLIATIGGGAACAKTVEHEGKRYMFYTEVSQDNVSFYMSLPKEIKCENARLCACYYRGIEKYVTEEFKLDYSKSLKNNGEFGTIGNWEESEFCIVGESKNDWSVFPFNVDAENFIYESEIENVSAEEVGLVFSLGENIFQGARVVLLDYITNTVVQAKMRLFTTDEEREWSLKNKFNLKIVVCGKTSEVYVNDVLVMHCASDYKMGKIGLFIEKGLAKFRDTKIKILRQVEND
ncbi:MAG: hypothetical protein E7353_04790 [Clostridiales bacterium]|nr:hypothetical protein [Clostridiales bacterium]